MKGVEMFDALLHAPFMGLHMRYVQDAVIVIIVVALRCGWDLECCYWCWFKYCHYALICSSLWLSCDPCCVL